MCRQCFKFFNREDLDDLRNLRRQGRYCWHAKCFKCTVSITHKHYGTAIQLVYTHVHVCVGVIHCGLKQKFVYITLKDLDIVKISFCPNIMLAFDVSYTMIPLTLLCAGIKLLGQSDCVYCHKHMIRVVCHKHSHCKLQ